MQTSKDTTVIPNNQGDGFQIANLDCRFYSFHISSSFEILTFGAQIRGLHIARKLSGSSDSSDMKINLVTLEN